jgi:hypothetical protein
MTTREDFSGGTVDRLLLEAGQLDVPELRAALLSIASLARMQVPAPGAELAAMLAGPGDELTKKRWLRQYRPAIVGLAVLAGMGLGVSGVAATSQVSAAGSGLRSIQKLTTDWAPDWTLPLAPAGSDQDGQAGWVSPLFLQLDATDPAAGDQTAGPDMIPAGAADPKAHATVPDGRAFPPAEGHDWAPGSASGNRNAAKPDAESAGGTKHETAPEERSGTDLPQTAAGTPEMAAPAPEEKNTEDRGRKNAKKDEAGAGQLAPVLDSAVEPLNSWLKKFKP